MHWYNDNYGVYYDHYDVMAFKCYSLIARLQRKPVDSLYNGTLIWTVCFFAASLNQLFGKQSSCWWFNTMGLDNFTGLIYCTSNYFSQPLILTFISAGFTLDPHHWEFLQLNYHDCIRVSQKQRVNKIYGITNYLKTTIKSKYNCDKQNTTQYHNSHQSFMGYTWTVQTTFPSMDK